MLCIRARRIVQEGKADELYGLVILCARHGKGAHPLTRGLFSARFKRGDGCAVKARGFGNGAQRPFNCMHGAAIDLDNGARVAGRRGKRLEGARFSRFSRMPRALASCKKARSIGSALAALEASAPARMTSSESNPGCGAMPPNESRFIVKVPVLSAHSTSIVAASSTAFRRVISTPRRASAIELMAMLAVSIAGNATGTAPIIRTSAIGSVSDGAIPRACDTTHVVATSAPTIAHIHLTRRVMTASECSFGRALSTNCTVRPK